MHCDEEWWPGKLLLRLLPLFSWWIEVEVTPPVAKFGWAAIESKVSIFFPPPVTRLLCCFECSYSVAAIWPPYCMLDCLRCRFPIWLYILAWFCSLVFSWAALNVARFYSAIFILFLDWTASSRYPASKLDTFTKLRFIREFMIYIFSLGLIPIDPLASWTYPYCSLIRRGSPPCPSLTGCMLFMAIIHNLISLRWMWD